MTRFVYSVVPTYECSVSLLLRGGRQSGTAGDKETTQKIKLRLSTGAGATPEPAAPSHCQIHRQHNNFTRSISLRMLLTLTGGWYCSSYYVIVKIYSFLFSNKIIGTQQELKLIAAALSTTSCTFCHRYLCMCWKNIHAHLCYQWGFFQVEMVRFDFVTQYVCLWITLKEWESFWKRQAKIRIKIPAPVGRCLFPWWRWACADVYDDLTHAYSPHMPPPPPLSRWRQCDCLHTAHGVITWRDPRNKAVWKTWEIHMRKPLCTSTMR